eukprot:symbB.v1.2.001363.t1/scaffold71.1/size352893/6
MSAVPPSSADSATAIQKEVCVGCFGGEKVYFRYLPDTTCLDLKKYLHSIGYFKPEEQLLHDSGHRPFEDHELLSVRLNEQGLMDMRPADHVKAKYTAILDKVLGKGAKAFKMELVKLETVPRETYEKLLNANVALTLARDNGWFNAPTFLSDPSKLEDFAKKCEQEALVARTQIAFQKVNSGICPRIVVAIYHNEVREIVPEGDWTIKMLKKEIVSAFNLALSSSMNSWVFDFLDVGVRSPENRYRVATTLPTKVRVSFCLMWELRTGVLPRPPVREEVVLQPSSPPPYNAGSNFGEPVGQQVGPVEPVVLAKASVEQAESNKNPITDVAKAFQGKLDEMKPNGTFTPEVLTAIINEGMKALMNESNASNAVASKAFSQASASTDASSSSASSSAVSTDASSSSASSSTDIDIVIAHGVRRFDLKVSPTITVKQLKGMICEQKGIKVKDIRLNFNENELGNKRHINTQGIRNNSVITLFVRGDGGAKSFIRSIAKDKKGKEAFYKAKAQELTKVVLEKEFKCPTFLDGQAICRHLQNFEGNSPALLFADAIKRMDKTHLDKIHELIEANGRSLGGTECRMEKVCEIVLGKVINSLTTHIEECDAIISSLKAQFIHHYTTWCFHAGKYDNEPFKTMVKARLEALTPAVPSQDAGLADALSKMSIG